MAVEELSHRRHPRASPGKGEFGSVPPSCPGRDGKPRVHQAREHEGGRLGQAGWKGMDLLGNRAQRELGCCKAVET